MSEECCVREMTISEEIMELDIEENIKNRILGKVHSLEREISKQDDYLFNCHCEIDRLKGAIVEQAKMINTLAEDKRSMNVSCNY